MSREIEEVAHGVVEELAHRGYTLATAESLTAGMITSTLASVPGASRVLRGGLVVYATDLKESLAGVDSSLLEKRGPIDPEVALQLARGARERCTADIGIGVTGVAGPDPQDNHAVGEIYCGISLIPLSESGIAERKEECYSLDLLPAYDEKRIDYLDRRQYLREQTVLHSLSLLIALLR